MRTHVFSKFPKVDLKVAALSSLFVFATAGAPVMAQETQSGQTGDQTQQGPTAGQAQQGQADRATDGVATERDEEFGQFQDEDADQDQAELQQDQDQAPAQQDDDQAQQEQDEDQAGVFGEEQQLRPGADLSEMTVGAVHGAEVVNAQGEVLGNINDLVVSRADESLHAVIDVGGWLGIGGTQIAVPVEELEIHSEDQLVYQTDATQEQIEEQAEDYNEEQYVSLGEDEMRLSVYMGERDRG